MVSAARCFFETLCQAVHEIKRIRANGHYGHGEVGLIDVVTNNGTLGRTAAQRCALGGLAYGPDQPLLVIANRGKQKDKIRFVHPCLRKGCGDGFPAGRFRIAKPAESHAHTGSHSHSFPGKMIRHYFFQRRA
jgi:hypothetical protein